MRINPLAEAGLCLIIGTLFLPSVYLVVVGVIGITAYFLIRRS